MEHRTSVLSIGKKWKYLTELVVDNFGNDSWQLGWPRDFSIVILIMVLFVTQGLIYLDLELFATQGLFYLNLEFVGVSIKGIIFFNLELLKWKSKVFSASIWSCWNGDMVIKGLLYFNLVLLKWRSHDFSTSIWNCCNGNQRSSLLQFGLLKLRSKVFSLLQSGIVEMLIKGLLYANLELLKCQSKVFST